MKTDHSPAISVQLVHGVLRYVEDRGGSAERVRARAKLRYSPDGDLIGAYEISNLLRFASAEISEPRIGISLGRNVDLGVMGMISYVVANAPNVRTSLNNLVRFQSSFVRGFNCFYKDGRDVSVGFRLGQGPASDYRDLEEFCVAVVVKTMHSLIGAQWVAKAVHFEHESPGTPDVYQSVFGCTPTFGHHRTELVISNEVADELIPFADRQLLPILERRLQSFDDNEDVFIDSLRSEIVHALCDGTPTVELIAERCAVSPRTLQRRLTDNGTSFRQQLTGLRQRLAKDYLNRSSADLLEIALLLGYADQSAFCHAFRNWFGQSPSDFRRLNDE